MIWRECRPGRRGSDRCWALALRTHTSSTQSEHQQTYVKCVCSKYSGKEMQETQESTTALMCHARQANKASCKREQRARCTGTSRQDYLWENKCRRADSCELARLNPAPKLLLIFRALRPLGWSHSRSSTRSRRGVNTSASPSCQCQNSLPTHTNPYVRNKGH